MTDKIVNLTEKKKEKTIEEIVDSTFEQEIARNKANEERMKKERLNKNKKVLKEYRIK